MILHSSSLMPSLARTTSIFSIFIKLPLPLIYHHCRSHSRPLQFHHSSLFASPLSYNIYLGRYDMEKRFSLCTVALSHEPPISAPVVNSISKKMRKKMHRESPEGLLRHKLGICSKNGDVIEALRLYDEAQSNCVELSQHHYNVLLYLCSGSNGDEVGNDSVVGRGFQIFKQMVADKVVPNESTFTNVARLAAKAEDPKMAFDLVKQMKVFGIEPKLRSYGPALFGFCKKGQAERAYEVDSHMIESGVLPEEPELSALLKVSVDSRNGERVYKILHRLRTTVRQVLESTAGNIEDWFRSEEAARVGDISGDVNKVKEGILKGGGGWHGQGWLGTGSWRVARTQMDERGVCQTCGEKLVCIDIDPQETENFARSLANLAGQKEVKADFVRFQEWLKRHGPFDAVIDGANVGLINQHNFSFFQLNHAVNELRQLSPSKRLPLVILHRNRVSGGPAVNPNNKNLIESWKKSGALYATPAGSNDDWYWLYAAVSCKCLLVTNDEMRDHLFQLLGNSFFPRWKEKHQVRLSVSRRGIKLHMPPPYSIVVQESEDGSWHVPMVVGYDVETPRQWLCATRARDTK